jgi:ABC-2 type transport system permease protein
LKADKTGEAGSATEENEGATKSDADAANDKPNSEDGTPPPAAEEIEINAILVSDIDWIAPVIFRLREIGANQDMLIDWKFQNVTFVLNILDSLAGDDRYVEIRKRTRPHRILTQVEEATEDFRQSSLTEQTKSNNEAREQIEQAKQDFREKITELEKRTDLDPRAKAQVMELERIRLERVRDVQVDRLEKDRNRKIKQSERELAAKVRGVQDFYKLCAVLLPPIPPILLAFFVFFHRRKAEQEGVDTRRLRFGHGEEEEGRK